MKTIIFALLFFVSFEKIFAQQTSPAKPDTINKKRLIAVASTEAVLYTGMMSYLQFVWYSDQLRTPYTFYNDNKGYLQMDKFGHAYTAYHESYVGYKAMRWAGVPKGKAMLYGGTLGFFLQLPVEVWDGFYDGWGFSWGDVAANTTGTALMLGQEALFDEQIVKYKMSFAPSPYAKQANGYLGKTLFNQFFMEDYNGHSYWLSVGLNKIIPSKKIPDWLNISVGYGANGMFGEFSNIKSWGGVVIPPTERYRQYLLSLDIDWTKIKTKHKGLKKLFNAMYMIKLPFPALEITSKGKWKFYGLYY